MSKNYDELNVKLMKELDELFGSFDDSDDSTDNDEPFVDSDISKLYDNIIVLNDETGNDVRFEFLDLIEYEGIEYVILLPEEESENVGEVVILKVDDTDGDEESFSSVDDEETLSTVFAIFKEKFKGEFDFVD